MNFRGKAKRLDDIDLPRIGARIGVGEDYSTVVSASMAACGSQPNDTLLCNLA